MRTLEFVCFEIASSSKQPLCCFTKTELKSDFNVCDFTVILKNCQLWFGHNNMVMSLINYPR